MKRLFESSERFLRISPDSPADVVMRMRAVWVIGAMVSFTQFINFFVLWFNYGRMTYDHVVMVAAIVLVMASVISVRWCKNANLYALLYSLFMLGAVMGSALPDRAGINTAALPLLVLGPVMMGFMAGKRVAMAFWGAGVVVLSYLFYVSLSNPPITAPFDYSRDVNRFVQALFALSISTGVTLMITEQLYAMLAELRETAQRASRAEAAKSQFLATMSHELRTPLNGVIGLTDALLASPQAERERRLTETIRKSGESLLLILNDLLDLSKIEAGRLTIEPRATDLRDLVRFVGDSWREAAAAKGLTIAVTVSPRTPQAVMIDDLRLRQILQNLVSNAVKFTSKGCVSLTLEARREVGERATLEIRVTDTGRGVPPAMQERIFDAFEQGEQGTTRQYGGTGLGLPICRMIAELMGGRIMLERSSPDGSTFLLAVTVPVAKDRSGLDDDVYDAAEDLRGVRVLVAEDNEVNRMVVSEFLKSWGAMADFAHDGAQCIDMAASSAYDVILMDKHMPGMSGMETAAAIRAGAGPGAAIPIIAVTADAAPGEREAMLAAGMSDFTPKPLRAEALKAVILKALRTRKAA